MKKYFFLTLILLSIILFASGCVGDLVPVGENTTQNLSAYGFEVFLNNSYDNGTFIPTHTFYLSSNGSAKVVSILENQSVIKIIPLEDLSNQNSDIVSDVVVLGDISNNTNATPENFEYFASMSSPSYINYTISDDVIRGQKYVYINFEEPVTGFVAYTMNTALGQDFVYITTPPSVVRYVLPAGYTTGNSLIGKANPEPNEIYYDSNGRENLVWTNEVTTSSFLSLLGQYSSGNDTSVEPIPKLISVKFYTKDAPRDLTIAAAVLGFVALSVYLRFRNERKKLEKIRNEFESQLYSKKKGNGKN
ncbi:hypothetical protein RE474_07615 [Methanolobus sediminis]|uniref:Uncharacterized protein n=1 Tax=Methanolobus sediminis TaxID=3072978 RepID=A0AA51YKH5_9EURY|nr:hypothetical protein [Methanolobus sediminis]WMW23969.1 hypothetical protein RE474_07615 [Methanolobus sediminis]